MTIAAGSRLGPYEILAPLGAGGMGEVWKARDTRLERTVAIKVLAQHLSTSEEVRQRFEREAKTISQLSHPHICALYDVGEADVEMKGEGRKANGEISGRDPSGSDALRPSPFAIRRVQYLVMEYLEGETLFDRLAKGPLPLEQTLRYGFEIADALDRAHRQGIVHRDLKPGNVMLTKGGVKLLDFGLAKLAAPSSGPISGLSMLPTTPKGSNLTAEGTILGTFQYMAPEQLEGKEADARTDIFAFGAVLYEMATGKKAFEGVSQASLIASIMGSQPQPMSAVAPMTPPALDRVVRTCLAKDPDDRWQSAHDIANELKWVAEGSAVGVAAPTAMASRRRSRERVAWGVVALLLVVSAWAAWAAWSRPRGASPVMRFEMLPPEKGNFNSADGPVTLSPDGRHLVYAVIDVEGRTFLWTRSMDSVEAHRLEGTEDAYDPFWSPDGRYIAFGSSGLDRVEASGGPIQRICEMTDGRGGDWNRDDVILMSNNGGSSPILRVSAKGGTPTPVTALDKTRGEIGHWRPRFLPDGRHFLFLIRSAQPENSGLAIGSLDSKDVRRLPGIDTTVLYSPPGLLLYVRQRSLMAQPFDVGKLATTGEPFAIARNVDYVPTWGAAAFSVSAGGILAYQRGGRTPRRLVWFDRSGKEVGVLGEPGEYKGDPRISPDGRRVATLRIDPEARSGDIWLLDVARGVGSRLTIDPAVEEDPVWSPDGSRLAFDSNRQGVADLYMKSSSGAGEEDLVFKSKNWKNALDWSNDGRFLLFRVLDPKTRADLWVLSLKDRKATPFLNGPFPENEGQFSPDGKWIAYTSTESGRGEVYVQPFPSTGEKWQISTNGGTTPRWRADGKELFYVAPDYMRKAVPIRLEPAFEAGVPQDLFRTPYSWGSDVSRDGQRFLVNMPAAETPPSPITVVLNWTAEPRK